MAVALRHTPRSGIEWRTTPKATVSPSARDLEWAAGFIEGEGCFYRDYFPKDKTRIKTQSIQANQVNPEPILRLQRLFGGTVKQSFNNCKLSDKCKPVWLWGVYGARARGVMMTLYSLLTGVRKQQVKHALGLA